MQRRVVVTGIGVVSPLGIGVESWWENLVAGKSGVGPITLFDTSGFDVTIGAEVRGFDPEAYMDRKEVRRSDRFVQLALGAAELALKDGAMDPAATDTWRFGCYVGSGIGGIATLEDQHEVLRTRGPSRISPFFIPMMIVNMAAGRIAIRWGLRGPNAAPVSACASGAHALGDSLRIIQRGDADLMLSGGVEAPITPMAVGGFASMKALSTRNDAPAKASRPFDKERDGFVIGEGAAMLLLEEESHARRRGARIYARLAGYGSTCDAYHMTAPASDGAGARESMRLAMRDAGLEPAGIDYVNAHGTSTDLNDKLESLAIREVLGEAAGRVAVSSNKSMTGHSLGAAGAFECAATAMTVHYGLIPPTINYETPDPECDLDYVPNRARRAPVRAALSNSFGFGGHNVCLAVTPEDGQGEEGRGGK